MKLTRLDELMVAQSLAKDLPSARGLILAGRVYSKGNRLRSAGERVGADIDLEIKKPDCPFVSRGGLKLAYALAVFSVEVKNRVCLDVGACTGGFTDCLLRSGAKHVFAIDVGYGKLDYTLRSDPRVTNLEKTNARFLMALPEGPGSPTLGVIDVSFVSLSTIMPALRKNIAGIKEWVCLFKPPFEVERAQVKRGGIVTDPDAVQAAMERVHADFSAAGLVRLHSAVPSPIEGKKSGNTEYLLHYAPVA